MATPPPTVDELEARVKAGEQISLTELAEAVKQDKAASLPVGSNKLIYEHGERLQEAGRRGVLWDEQYHRDHFDSGNIKEHIEKLSGKERKPSL